MATEASGDTYTTWLLDAFERVHTQLVDELGPARPPSTLFPTRTDRRAARRAGPDRMVAITLRVTDAEREILEAREAEVGPVSRSDFVTAVVRLGLAGSTTQAGEGKPWRGRCDARGRSLFAGSTARVVCGGDRQRRPGHALRCCATCRS